MNYADIRPIDVANGPGVRVSLFVSGCTHHCEGCFNPETWDFQYGKPFGPEQEEEVLSALARPYIHGLSLLGGEPMEPENQQAILHLVRRVRERFPEKDIWCYSGYLFPRLAAGEVGRHSREILELLDVLVDGPFILERKSLSIRFRGSDNQRLIDVPASEDGGDRPVGQDRVSQEKQNKEAPCRGISSGRALWVFGGLTPRSHHTPRRRRCAGSWSWRSCPAGPACPNRR